VCSRYCSHTCDDADNCFVSTAEGCIRTNEENDLEARGGWKIKVYKSANMSFCRANNRSSRWLSQKKLGLLFQWPGSNPSHNFVHESDFSFYYVSGGTRCMYRHLGAWVEKYWQCIGQGVRLRSLLSPSPIIVLRHVLQSYSASHCFLMGFGKRAQKNKLFVYLQGTS
jgi:hypothetical protein